MRKAPARAVIYTLVAALLVASHLASGFYEVAIVYQGLAREILLKQIAAVQELQEERRVCRQKDVLLRRIIAEFKKMHRRTDRLGSKATTA